MDHCQEETTSDADKVSAAKFLLALGLDHPGAPNPDMPDDPGGDWGAKPWGHDMTWFVEAASFAIKHLESLGVKMPAMTDKVEQALHLLTPDEFDEIKLHLSKGRDWSSQRMPLAEHQQEFVRRIVEHHKPAALKTLQFSMSDQELCEKLAADLGVEFTSPVKLALPRETIEAVKRKHLPKRPKVVQFSQSDRERHDQAEAAAFLRRVGTRPRGKIADRLEAAEFIERTGPRKR